MLDDQTSPETPEPQLSDLDSLVADAIEKAAPLGRLEASRPCPRCQHELSGIPVTGRYCPRCGIQLLVEDAGAGKPPPFATVIRESIEDSVTVRRIEQLRPVAAQAGDHPERGRRRSILRGYASALYRLGWRYESANGATRNLDEALRCYGKAARLNRSEAAGETPV